MKWNVNLGWMQWGNKSVMLGTLAYGDVAPAYWLSNTLGAGLSRKREVMKQVGLYTIVPNPSQTPQALLEALIF